MRSEAKKPKKKQFNKLFTERYFSPPPMRTEMLIESNCTSNCDQSETTITKILFN